MLTVCRKCFVCSTEIIKVNFLSPDESSFMSKEILEISNWTNEIQRIKFEGVCYCLNCYTRILKIRIMFGEFEFEKEILQEKYKIVSQLIESYTESDKAFIINEHEKLKNQRKGMLQLFRHEIITKLSAISIQIMSEKILEKEVARKYDHHPSGSIQNVKDVGTPKSTTLIGEIFPPEEPDTHSRNVNCPVSSKLSQCIPGIKISTASLVSHQLPSNEKDKIDHFEPECLTLNDQNLSPSDEFFEENLPIVDADISFENNMTSQVPPTNEGRILRSKGRKKISMSENDGNENITTSIPNRTICDTRNSKKFRQTNQRSLSAIRRWEKRYAIQRKSYILPCERSKKCQECGMVLSSPATWREHKISRHSLDTKYKCKFDKCIYTSGKLPNLLKHMNNFHSEEIKLGSIRSKYFTKDTVENFFVPLCRRPTVCQECGKVLARISSLNEHMIRVHGAETKFKCTFCKFGTGYSTAFAQHMNIHSKENNSNPSSTQNIPSSDFNANDDSKISKESRIKQKKLINSETENDVNTSPHNQNVNGTPTTVKKSSVPKCSKSAECPECGRVLAKSSALKEHMIRVHGAEGRFKCVLCEFSTSYSAHVTRHMYTHPEGKKSSHSRQTKNIPSSGFKAKDNSKSSKESTLKQKKTINSEIENDVNTSAHNQNMNAAPTVKKSNFPICEKPKTCRECDKVLPSKYAWKEHMSHEHDTKEKFKCKLCTFGTGKLSNFFQHMATHSDKSKSSSSKRKNITTGGLKANHDSRNLEKCVLKHKKSRNSETANIVNSVSDN